MKKEICISCNRSKSLIKTEVGTVCFQCYSANPGKYTKVKSKRQISHEESDIQTEFFDKVPLFFPTLPDKILFAVPNGGSRHIAEAKRMKGEGVKSGVSDVILLVPKKGFASLCMEFKTSTGKQSKEQKEFQRQAEMCGSKYVIVRSAAQAIREMRNYMK